jgi:hypothetical protein
MRWIGPPYRQHGSRERPTSSESAQPDVGYLALGDQVGMQGFRTRVTEAVGTPPPVAGQRLDKTMVLDLLIAPYRVPGCRRTPAKPSMRL